MLPAGSVAQLFELLLHGPISLTDQRISSGAAGALVDLGAAKEIDMGGERRLCVSDAH